MPTCAGCCPPGRWRTGAATMRRSGALAAGWPPRPAPRARAGRALACLQDLEAQREAAEAAAREQGQAYLEALAAGAATGRPPAAVALAAQQLRADRLVAAQQAAIEAWQAGRAAGTGSRLRRRPAGPQGTPPVRRAPARAADLPAQAAAEAEAHAAARRGQTGQQA